MKKLLYVVVATGLLLCPGVAAADAAADIEAAGQEFESALNDGDADRLAELYTEDAIVLPPDMPRVEGRDGAREVFQGFIDAGVSDAQLTADEIEVFGEVAYKIGSYRITLPGEDGSATTDTGKFLEVWMQQADGTWQIHRDIWNSDGPAE